MSIEGIKVQISGISPQGLKSLCPLMKDKSEDDLKDLLVFTKQLRDDELKQKGEHLQVATYRILAGAIGMKLGNDWPEGLAWEEKEVAKDVLNLMI